MRWLKDELGPDRLVAAGSIATAFALVMFGLAHDAITAIAACLLAGAAWTIVLTKLYVSAQVALPDWARGRGLAVFLTFIFGATTAGSAGLRKALGPLRPAGRLLRRGGLASCSPFP